MTTDDKDYTNGDTNGFDCQTKVNDLSYKINELERNLTIKTWNIDRKYRHYFRRCSGYCVATHLTLDPRTRPDKAVFNEFRGRIATIVAHIFSER